MQVEGERSMAEMSGRNRARKTDDGSKSNVIRQNLKDPTET